MDTGGYVFENLQASDEHVPVPLCNLSNTCFMKSAVQLLAASPQLRTIILNHVLIHNVSGKHILLLCFMFNLYPAANHC